MKISSQIGHSNVEAMEKILAFINSFNVDKLLHAINSKRFNEDTIRSFVLDIREQNIRLERQMQHLYSFGETFNEEYTTSDNKCFDTSARLCFKMRSGIKGIKRTLKKCCKSSRRTLRTGQETPQAIDKTLIASKHYMVDMFGLDSYPEYVEELFAEMMKFYNNMHSCLEESLRVISEEKTTRRDVRKCLDLLKLACEKSRRDQIIFIEAMNDNPALKNAILQTKALMPNDDNPVLNEWKDSEVNENRRESFASRYFHNCTLEDVSKITFYEAVTEAEGDSELMTCIYIFNCDSNKARQIDTAIRKFDALLPDKCKRNQIPSLYLFIFMRWCSEGIGYESFLNYFGKLYIESGGQWGLIKKAALSGAASECARSTTKYQNAKKDIMAKLRKMFPQEEVQQSA